MWEQKTKRTKVEINGNYIRCNESEDKLKEVVINGSAAVVDPFKGETTTINWSSNSKRLKGGSSYWKGNMNLGRCIRVCNLKGEGGSNWKV